MTPISSDTSVLSPTNKGPFKAPRGTQITCKGWQQEAALRMLMNNLDPEVAEKPLEKRRETGNVFMPSFNRSRNLPWTKHC
jgi:hypothetical protein